MKWRLRGRFASGDDYPKAEAKAPPGPAKRRHVAGCILRHLSNGLSAENASAVEFALVQEHLRETSVVTKRAAHACAARVAGGLREDTARVEIGGAFRNGGASSRSSAARRQRGSSGRPSRKPGKSSGASGCSSTSPRTIRRRRLGSRRSSEGCTPALRSATAGAMPSLLGVASEELLEKLRAKGRTSQVNFRLQAGGRIRQWAFAARPDWAERPHPWRRRSSALSRPGWGGERQSKATPCKALSNAPVAPLWGEDEEREPVPLAGDAERQVPNARRRVSGSAEG